MIVYWHKCVKSKKIEQNFNTIDQNTFPRESILFTVTNKSDDIRNRTKQNDSNNNNGGEVQLEKNSSKTSATSLQNQQLDNNNKDFKSLTEIDISGIIEDDEFEDLFISKLESSFNIFDEKSMIDSEIDQESDTQYFLQNFSQITSNDLLYQSLLRKLDKNPYAFIKIFFPKIIKHSNEIMIKSTCYMLMAKLFAYFSKEHKEIFYKKIIKNNFQMIYSNQYSAIVLNQFIHSITNDIVMYNIIEHIKTNIVDMITNQYGNMIIISLLTQRNKFIVKLIYDSIIRNCIMIALGDNGFKVIVNLIEGSCCSQKIIEVLIQNIARLLVNINGYLIIKYLLTLHCNQVSIIIVNHLSSNLSFYSMGEYSIKVIEECLNLCNEIIILPMINAFCNNKGLVKQLATNQTGYNLLMKVIECSPQIAKNFLLSQMIR